MLKGLVVKGTQIGVCGSCIDARGIKAEFLIKGTHRSSIEELMSWTQEADKVLVF
jgi:uncharacterized protein involved in oxidation of intracellular sulfur